MNSRLLFVLVLLSFAFSRSLNACGHAWFYQTSNENREQESVNNSSSNSNQNHTTFSEIYDRNCQGKSLSEQQKMIIAALNAANKKALS